MLPNRVKSWGLKPPQVSGGEAGADSRASPRQVIQIENAGLLRLTKRAQQFARFVGQSLRPVFTATARQGTAARLLAGMGRGPASWRCWIQDRNCWLADSRSLQQRTARWRSPRLSCGSALAAAATDLEQAQAGADRHSRPAEKNQFLLPGNPAGCCGPLRRWAWRTRPVRLRPFPFRQSSNSKGQDSSGSSRSEERTDGDQDSVTF